MVNEHPRQRTLAYAALVGSFGMALGILGDVFSLYNLAAARDVDAALVVGPRQLLAFLTTKPLAHFVTGHFFALFGLPLGLFGVWSVVNIIRRRFPRGASVTAVVSTLGYVLGVAWHAVLGMAGAAVSGVPQGVEGAEMAARLTPMVLATTISFYVVAFAAFATIFVQLLADKELPRWLPWLSPLPVHIVGFAAAAALPPPPGIFLQFTLSNISGVVFYLLVAALLFSEKPGKLRGALSPASGMTP